MKLEKAGKKILLNGTAVSRRAFETVCREYFTAPSLERLLQDLEKYGRVHVAFVLVNREKEGF